MNIYRKLLLISILLSLLVFPKSAYAQVGDILPSGIPVSQIGTEIEAFVDKNRTSTAGMAVTVFSQDKVIYQNVFGFEDITAEKPVTTSSVFEWGSVSKLVVWSSVMQLWEQGKLDLYADIRNYLPEGFLSKLKSAKPINLIDLMTHQAGFQETLVNIFTQDKSAISTLEAALKDTEPPQIYEPGEYTAYSNWGTALAAHIVERVSGKSYDQYVHENIFSPLGIQNTAIRPDLSDVPSVQGRTDSMRCFTPNVKEISACKFLIPLYPAGMITGTIDDFAKFAQALNPLGQVQHLIFKDPTTIEKLFETTSTYPGTDHPRNAHGLWAHYFGVKTYGHGGNTAGQSANLLIDPASGFGIVVMTNQAEENTYNYEMPELVFGKFDPKLFGMADRSLPSGFFQGTRTILVGPMSLYRLTSFVSMEPGDLEAFWVISQRDGKDILSYTVIDFVKLTPIQIAIYLIFVLLVVIAVFGGLIALFTGLFRIIIKRNPEHRQQVRSEKPLFHWRQRSWGFLLLFVLLLVGLLISGLTFQASFVLYILIGGFILLFLLIGWHLVRLLRKAGSFENNKKERSLTTWVACLLGLALFYILYWQLYQFWNL